MNAHFKDSLGFTLIEVLTTLAILGVLVAMAIPVYEVSQRRSQEAELRSSLRKIRAAIDDYHFAYKQGRIVKSLNSNGYPASLEVLLEGINDQTDPSGKRQIFFISRIPRDPFADSKISAEKTWGLRSYQSSHDAPQAGTDVFDVYSKSPEMGINGIPYKEW